jgi:hypothetical protein
MPVLADLEQVSFQDGTVLTYGYHERKMPNAALHGGTPTDRLEVDR